MYRQRNKALAVGVFAVAASLFHLILDDLDNGIISYLYPLYSEPFSLFPLLSADPSEMGILYSGFTTIVGVLSIVLVVLMAFLSLRYLGFGFRYDPFKREE